MSSKWWPPEPWKPEEDDVIRRLYTVCSDAKIADMLKRPRHSVAHRRLRMGLSKATPVFTIAPSRYRAVVQEECAKVGADPSVVASNSQLRKNCRIRWAIWQRLRDAGASLPAIAAVAGRHHSTVLLGLRQYARLQKKEEQAND